MGWNKYNENRHFEEDAIDADTREEILSDVEKQRRANKLRTEGSTHLIKWAEHRTGRKFVSHPAQRKALKQLHSAGLSMQEIQQRWKELENTDFYKKNGMDFYSLVNSFNKKR